jgi:hypothetical protein
VGGAGVAGATTTVGAVGAAGGLLIVLAANENMLYGHITPCRGSASPVFFVQSASTGVAANNLWNNVDASLGTGSHSRTLAVVGGCRRGRSGGDGRRRGGGWRQPTFKQAPPPHRIDPSSRPPTPSWRWLLAWTLAETATTGGISSRAEINPKHR